MPPLPLTPGSQLGPYSIVSPLGAGGMGEVYRARDTRLDREVAIKVLSEAFANDADRLQRFRREAQLLAALNHPRIAQIYAVEEADGIHALVMELVEGEDLAVRLTRGPLPLDDAAAIAEQIAEALEAAHEQGIVHRDLKPANIKLRRDGSVKVLDFGLAKTLVGVSTAAALANSPTTASPVVTTAGMLLGTAAYMSPEQARGKAVDRRADIWAFGAVLYEMVTGRSPFGGETVTDVLAAIVSREPDWTALPSGVPARVRWLLRRCLEKDPRLRLRDIGEARVALQTGASEAFEAAATGVAPSRHSHHALTRALPWVLTALALVMAAVVWSLTPRTSGAPTRRFEVALPRDGAGFALSPDGRYLAFLERGQVRVMDLVRFESRDLAPSPQGPRRFVFWSPDSTFIGYNTPDGKLWKIPVAGGTPLVVCAVPESGSLMGATWRNDQTIVFAVWRGSLYTVPASGGPANQLLAIDPKRELDFHSPLTLPGGRVLVTTHLTPTQENQTSENTRVEVLDGERRDVVLGPGFTPIAYVSGRFLLAQRFDVNVGLWAFPFSGEGALRVDEGRLLAANAQSATAAEDGTLLYALPSATQSAGTLAWVDRTGRVTGQLGAEHADLASPAIAPDGQRIAYAARVNGNRDLWVRQLASNTESRLTFEPGDEVRPVWFPSGRRLAYLELLGVGLNRIASRNADGSGGRQELVAGVSPAVSPDGRFLLFLIDEAGSLRLRMTELSLDGRPGPIRRVFNGTPEPSIEGASVSPDGRVLAFASDSPMAASTSS
jgi:eukaryotic-like serine/threonine-protein kinase